MQLLNVMLIIIIAVPIAIIIIMLGDDSPRYCRMCDEIGEYIEFHSWIAIIKHIWWHLWSR